MNTTTLNMTTLDGGVIIKKGGGGGTTPPSEGSGENEFFMKYYDIDALVSSLGGTIDKTSFITIIKENLGSLVFLLARISASDNTTQGVMPLSIFPEDIFSDVSKLGFLYGLTIVEDRTTIKVTPEFVSQRLEGLPLDQFEITKEQFYSLD